MGVECPVCGSKDVEHVFLKEVHGNYVVIANERYTFFADRLFRCKKCGVLFTATEED